MFFQNNTHSKFAIPQNQTCSFINLIRQKFSDSAVILAIAVSKRCTQDLFVYPPCGHSRTIFSRLLFHCNGPFYRYGGHIEFIRFTEYYGMSRGHSLSIYARFLGKKRTSMYISPEKGDHYYSQTRHNDLFSHYNLFLGDLKKIGPKSAHKY